MTISLAKLIRSGEPDRNGKAIPANIVQGSGKLTGIHGNRDQLNIGMAVAVFNSRTGTCTYTCITCDGAIDSWTDPASLSLDGVSGLGTIECIVEWADCTTSDETSQANMYSDNTSIATVNSSGQVTGVAIGSTNIEGSATFTGIGQGGQACSLNNPRCGIVHVYWTAGVTVNVVICMGSTKISGTTQSAVVGQQIALTASATNTCSANWPPSGKTVQHISWSPQGTVVGDYQPSTGNTDVTDPTLTNQSATFYWAYTGQALNVTLSVDFTDNTNSMATATFNITGPTGGSTTATAYQGATIQNLGSCTGHPGGIYLEFGASTGTVCQYTGGTVGIQFNSPSNYSNTSGGSFLFVQLVNQDQVFSPNGNTAKAAGLDTQYPYASPPTNDGPSTQLFSSDTSVERLFKATMYLMWKSNTSNSIPVPIAKLQWTFDGTATCSSSCGSSSNWTATTTTVPPATATFTASSASQSKHDFPTWGGLSQ
jgi:hypothetical protein